MEKNVIGLQESSILQEPQIEIRYEISNKLDETKDSLNVLSLFSGCGGMDLGFEGGFSVLTDSINELKTPHFIENIEGDKVRLKKTKFKTVFANDIFTDARNNWLSYFSKRGHSPDIFYSESIVDLVKMHHLGIKIFPDNVDVVTGGFPCQDFSIAGKRNGLNSHKNHHGKIIKDGEATEETRGKLYMWMKQVIEITKPKIFIAENVKGLINLENVKEIIQNDFSGSGKDSYLVLDPQVLHAANFGVPQSRERVIFIGIRKSELSNEALKALTQKTIPEEFSPYPTPTHSDKNETLKPYVKLKDLFRTLEEPETSRDLSQRYYSKAKYMGSHCQGQTEIKLHSIAPTIRSEHHGNIEFRRLSKENGGRHNLDEINAGFKERRLTPRECALIQTFPDDYEFVIKSKEGRKGSFLVSPSQAYKVIGNAVPPLLAYNIAKRIEGIWDIYFKK